MTYPDKQSLLKRMLRKVYIMRLNGCVIRNLDIALLRTFVTVADHASMTAAGNALNLTQSAISQQIARLEGLAGPVFVREHRRVRLTAMGERLLPKARRLLALNDDLWRDMTPIALSPPVRFGAPHDLTATWLVPILKSFAQAHPLVEIALTCMASPDLVEAVAGGALDLALVEEPAGPTQGSCLMVDRLVWVGARGGTAYLKTPLPVSLVAETCAFRPVVLDALGTQGMTWRTLFDSGSIEATNAMVRADLSVTTWLAFTVPNDLAVLPSDAGLPALPRFAVNLHRSRGQGTPAAIELERHIQQSLTRHRDPA
jgi:DNA-binding transcriptional LysR family regulator